MRHSELPDCCLEFRVFHTPGCITIYITFHCIIGVDIFPYTSTRKTGLFPSWGIQYSNKIFNQGEKCCKQIQYRFFVSNWNLILCLLNQMNNSVVSSSAIASHLFWSMMTGPEQLRLMKKLEPPTHPTRVLKIVYILWPPSWAFGKIRPPPRRKMKNPPFFREKGRRFHFPPSGKVLKKLPPPPLKKKVTCSKIWRMR